MSVWIENNERCYVSDGKGYEGRFLVRDFSGHDRVPFEESWQCFDTATRSKTYHSTKRDAQSHAADILKGEIR